MSDWTRLREGGEPEWRELLRYTKTAGSPPPERVEALAARVVAELSAPRAAGDGVAVAHTRVSTRVIWTCAALVAALGLGALHLRKDAPLAPRRAARSVAAAPVIVPPAPAAQASPARQESATVAEEHDRAAAQPAAPRPRVRSGRGAPGATQPSTQAKRPNPTAEIALLKSARRALASDPLTALGFVEQHLREHPRGVFVEEREALAVEALWRAGDRERADLRLRAMLATYPRSTYRERLTALLAGPLKEP